MKLERCPTCDCVNEIPDKLVRYPDAQAFRIKCIGAECPAELVFWLHGPRRGRIRLWIPNEVIRVSRVKAP